MFAIKDFNTGEIDESTVADEPDECWNNHLGFRYRGDDQWAWQVQQSQENGFHCVEVKLTAIPNKKCDQEIAFYECLRKTGEYPLTDEEMKDYMPKYE